MVKSATNLLFVLALLEYADPFQRVFMNIDLVLQLVVVLRCLAHQRVERVRDVGEDLFGFRPWSPALDAFHRELFVSFP